MEGLNDFDSLLQSTPEFAELASMLEETKKEIYEETKSAMSKLEVDVQAFADLNDNNLDYQALYKKIDWFIEDRENEENRDEYICCILSEMTKKSELKRNLYRQTKEWKNFLSPEEFKVLEDIELWRTGYLTGNINDPITKEKIKSLLYKLIKTYKEKM